MARENQGLHIVLIVFVLISIVLGVTTYLGFKNENEALTAKKKAESEAASANDKSSKAEAELKTLKQLIGAAETDSADAIRDTMFKEDMSKYAGGVAGEKQNYHHICEVLKTARDMKDAELSDWQAKNKELDASYNTRIAEKEDRNKRLEEANKKFEADLAKVQADLTEQREQLVADAKKAHDEAVTVSKKSTTDVNKANAETDRQKKRVEQQQRLVRDLSGKIRDITVDKIKTANGEISWVNQRNAVVWINLGRADGLLRQQTFSVWPSEVDIAAQGKKKGDIEVTQILSDHLAEARVLGDQLTNPFLPGDRIYTPLWSTGVKRHFAIAGKIDLEGDGRTDLQTLVNLITSQGGVVDCYLGDSGKEKDKIIGKITSNTNCLILGAAPMDTGSTAQQVAVFTKMNKEAEELGVQKQQLGDFLLQAGWRNMSPVVRYGIGSNPDDFRAKPDYPAQRKSTGSVSDLYKKGRQPPLSTSSDKNSTPETPKSNGGGRSSGMYFKY